MIEGEFPKTIWMFWQQGFDAAPVLVQKCLASWRRHNPNWRIVLLDEKNLREYVDTASIVKANRDIISVQSLSNIIRINLLAQRGGVWVDATCFCCRPLDDWLPARMGSGFFVFDNPGRERIMASWFMASTNNCRLTKIYCDWVNAFWSENHFTNKNARFARLFIRLAGKILHKHPRLAALWTQPLVAKTLKLYPYHWFHYLFARLVNQNAECAGLWRQSQTIRAAGPVRLKHIGLLEPAS
ncbi:MAG TPA: capsular polysaccharide synthesis protein, partial [Candidatus Sulfotelmatobacter sp.]|nr:capsular polysaccharide synthesis protein [Candidatus Sulfotelmatobacter sp.]